MKIGEAAYDLSKKNSAVNLLKVLMTIDEGDKITTRGKLCENVPGASVSTLSLLVH